ncbi:MAG: hypothetical protein LBK53_04290 [Heliobacteriaceae bacterium]|jgi:hypothetical protein|nr:hypothetical protein [Heliobacteriaceae bacterium]
MKKIAFWGFPDPEIAADMKQLYPQAQWIDLDIDYGAPDRKILPDNYCKIIKNIINNAFNLKDELIITIGATGKEKCDSGWFAAKILQDNGFNVVETKYEKIKPQRELKISTSDLPLYDKVNLIINGITETKPVSLQACKPQFGFWGVPPNDLEVLKLFPDTTHVYGWTRCVEAGVPADIDLEMYAEPDVPTVFYAQAFCSKCQLAKYLADKYNGLYIDIDDYAGNSVKAKIEAFLKLR